MLRLLIFQIAQTIDLGECFSLSNTCYWLPILVEYLAVNSLVLNCRYLCEYSTPAFVFSPPTLVG